MSAEGHNILVISDLHLGEDIRPEVVNADEFEAMGQELTDFLHHYAENRRDDLPWRLIINGDMVDFLSVCLMPQDVGTVAGLHAGDHTWGLGSYPAAALMKMKAVVERHAPFFDALARFVGEGNELAIVVGNHDAEFIYPTVQSAFVDGIVQKWTDSDWSMHDGVRTPADVRAAITFHPWFFFEKDCVWVEHGHLYDAYCTPEFVLDPADPTTEDVELEQNVGDAVMYYIANHLEDSPESQQNKGFVAYLRLPFERTERAVMLFSGYFTMSYRLLHQWADRRWRPDKHAERRERHLAAVREMATHEHVPREVLEELMTLRASPVFVTFMELITALMLGRFVLTVSFLLLIPPLLMVMPWPTGLIAVGSLAVGLVMAHVLLALGRVEVDPRAPMQVAAQRIRDAVAAPIIVMGHSHHPVARRLREGGWYFNTGTWVGGHEKLQNFTHLMVRRGSKGIKAALCQWRDGRSWELRAELARDRYKAPWGIKGLKHQTR